jgi:integrase
MSTFKVDMMTIHLQYCWKKPGTPTLYYRRRVPQELQAVLGRKVIVESLKTSDPKIAAERIKAMTALLDRQWSKFQVPGKAGLLAQAQELLHTNGVDYFGRGAEEGPLLAFHDKLEDAEVNGKLPEPHRTAVQLLKGTFVYSLSVLRDQYVEARPADKDRCERAFKYLQEYLGADPDFRTLRRPDANGFVKFLQGKEMRTSTVKRYLSPLKAAFSRCIVENELGVDNVFAKVEIPKFGEDVQDREVYTEHERKLLLNAIEAHIVRHGHDTLRSILLVVAETGARLAEITGLAKDDLRLDGDIPYIALKPHPWRTLKTPGSTRKIPLSDRARRSLCDARTASKDAALLYPQYGNDGADTASAALVKWVRSREGLKGTKLGVHSLRHTMKDLLRTVKCPMEASDQILGHATPGMGANYGEGYPIEMLYEYVIAATSR